MIPFLRLLLKAFVGSMLGVFRSVAWGFIKIKQYPRVLALGRCGFSRVEKHQVSMSENYAILATQGQDYRDDGFLELLRVLVYLKINPFIVISGNIPEEKIQELSSLAHILAIRPNFGRDMAAFKEATLYLHDQGLIPKRVLYFNDSLIYLSGSALSAMVADLLDTESDVMGATQSLARRHHLGSFIFSLSGLAFSHPGVLKFWESYRQYNLRPHCIFNGEIGLSRCLQKNGFRLDALYTVGRAAAQIESLAYDDLLKQFSLLQPNSRASAIKFFIGAGDGTFSLELARQSAVDLIFSHMNQSQVHAYFGIFHVFLQMPVIKKDLLYRGIYTEKDMALILAKLPEKRKKAIFQLLNSRGLESEMTGVVTIFKRVLMLQ